MDAKTISIDYIGLSNRSQNALHRANVHSVGDLLQQTEESLLKVRNLGRKSIEEILKKKSEYMLMDAAGGLPNMKAEKVQDVSPEVSDTSAEDATTLSIDRIGLSNRSRNALRKADVHSVADLLQMTEESLLKVRNLGSKSIEEILKKRDEYRLRDWTVGSANSDMKPEQINLPERFDLWIQEDSGKSFVISWLKKHDYKTDCLELLSPRSYNLLTFNGYDNLNQVVFLSEAELMQIPRMDVACAGEIVRLCKYFLQEKSEDILSAYRDSLAFIPNEPAISVYDMLKMPKYRSSIYKYVLANDRDIRQIGLSARPLKRLLGSGLTKMSDIIFLTRSELYDFSNMGRGSVEDVIAKISDYLTVHEKRIMAVCDGDYSVLYDDEGIRERILNLYQEIGFGGLSLNEMMEQLKFPEEVTSERMKKIIGSLIAENELEYVDFRCYRVYGRFSDYLERCTSIDNREKDIIRKRLQGNTLESIAQEYNLTRERVRQIVKKKVQMVRSWYSMSTGKVQFDEDYYRYLYSNYDFDKRDGIEWLGMTADVCNYLDMMDVKRGTRDLQSALEDKKNLDAGVRLKIKNYLNRNKLYIDGMWIEKRRADLEEVVVRKFCQDDVSFDEFAQMYNDFLEQEEVPFDEKIYLTESVYRTRKARLSDASFVLWKQNEQIRYYDIEGRDFSELLDTLNLESYENTELSTVKFVESYPEILKKYDIRDQYELHNLLRKIVPEGSYHDFCCSRTPVIKFGVFDRDSAMLDILIDNAPISVNDLCELVHSEYGYDNATIQANYLQAFSEYYHQGMYIVDQKVMSAEHREALKSVLPGDFYYIDEVRKIYHRLFPNADLEDVNSYNLKMMGFSVMSNYVLQNYSSVEAFFEDLLTKEDIVDITAYRKRYVYVQMFSSKLMELKRNLVVIEFEPNQIINFRKLEESGITREMVQNYCDAVFDYVEDKTYFSAQSLIQDGFESELYDLGFSDWFYANLLISDDRFSSGRMFGNIILYKGVENTSIKSFVISRIREYGSIDTYDLMSELTGRFGCKISDHLDAVYKVQGTEIYYDKILDRLYANADLYYRELDEMEGI